MSKLSPFRLLVFTLMLLISNTTFSADSPNDPMMAPSFILPDTNNRSHNIEEWKGQVIVLNFWATWCTPCRKEIPLFIGLQAKFASKGLQFIGVAIDEMDATRDFVEKYNVNYPILVGEFKAMSVSQHYGNSLGILPYTVVIDREGKIVYQHQGEFSEKKLIEIISPLL